MRSWAFNSPRIESANVPPPLLLLLLLLLLLPTLPTLPTLTDKVDIREKRVVDERKANMAGKYRAQEVLKSILFSKIKYEHFEVKKNARRARLSCFKTIRKIKREKAFLFFAFFSN